MNTEITLPDQVGDMIRRARQQKGLTQSALAKKIDTSQARISQIERGHRKQVKDSVLAAIAEALEIPKDDFIRSVIVGETEFPLPSKSKPLAASLHRVVSRIADLPEDKQEEIGGAIQWLVEWRYGILALGENR